MEKILVTGATGKLGSKVIAHLLKKTLPNQVIALVRNERKCMDLISKGVDVRYGDYTDVDSLNAAMKGVTRVLLISGEDLATRFSQHKNVIEAAKRNGVQFIAYTSISIKNMQACRINALTKSHQETEEHLINSGITYAILRNTFYADDLPYYIGHKETILSKGIVSNAGGGRVPFALRDEMAEAFANLLLQQAPESRIYEIGNSKAFSFAEMAAALSLLTQRSIRYSDTTTVKYATKLHKIGLPELIVIFLIQTGEDIKNDQFDIVTGDLEQLLGRQPANLSTILKLVFELASH